MTPQDFPVRRINRADTVGPALDNFSILQSRELPSSSDEEHTARQNHLRRQTQILRLPNLAPRRAGNRPHTTLPRNVNALFVNDGICFCYRKAFFVDSELFSDSLLARARVERGHAFIK